MFMFNSVNKVNNVNNDNGQQYQQCQQCKQCQWSTMFSLPLDSSHPPPSSPSSTDITNPSEIRIIGYDEMRINYDDDWIVD